MSGLCHLALSLKDIVEIVESLVTIAAILAGGVWAYFNYFRGRTYRPRLEPTVTTAISSSHDGVCLLVTSNLKNVGLSKLPIVQQGTALTVFSSSRADANLTPSWKRLDTYEMFLEHAWLEPGETISEQHLAFPPADDVSAYKAVLRVVSSKISWEASSIVIATPNERSSSPDATKGEPDGGSMAGMRQKDEDKEKTKRIEEEKEQSRSGFNQDRREDGDSPKK